MGMRQDDEDTKADQPRGDPRDNLFCGQSCCGFHQVGVPSSRCSRPGKYNHLVATRQSELDADGKKAGEACPKARSNMIGGAVEFPPSCHRPASHRNINFAGKT